MYALRDYLNSGDHHTLPQKRSLHTALTAGIPEMDLSNYFTEDGEIKNVFSDPVYDYMF